jgi:isopenicillin N synthase-like dioxygenase
VKNFNIPQLSFELIKQKDKTALDQLASALQSFGFITFTDHGLEDSLLDQAYTVSKDFFSLPAEVKQNYARPDTGGARGYTQFGKETAVGESIADLKEFWHHGPEVDDSYDSRIRANIPIKELEQFNLVCAKLFKELHSLGMSVLQSIALILNKSENFFDPWVVKGNSVLRLIHYPPVTDKTNLLRARAHADINLITLLVGAEESGLEVQHKDGTWIPIEAASKSIVCNIGDMMQLVTRGQLKSTVHRVVDYNLGDPKPRYSIPFFLHPSPDIILKSIVDDSKESVSAHDFLEERIREIKLY